MRPLSHISYYLTSGILFCVCSALVYHGWDYYALRIHDRIVCPAHANVLLLSFLWLCEGIALIACFAGLCSISGHEHDLQGSSLLVNYACVFLKVCPSIVKLLQLFNLCQLSTVCLDLLLLHECNDVNLRVIFGNAPLSPSTCVSVIAISINWFVVFLGLTASSEIFLPPHLYEPASVHRTYWEFLKVCLAVAHSMFAGLHLPFGSLGFNALLGVRILHENFSFLPASSRCSSASRFCRHSTTLQLSLISWSCCILKHD